MNSTPDHSDDGVNAMIQSIIMGRAIEVRTNIPEMATLFRQVVKDTGRNIPVICEEL